MKYPVKTFIFILLGVAVSCNPLAKKQEQLRNCKITPKSLTITSFNMLLIPPVPKIYFKLAVDVENTNDVPVTIEKFFFNILTVPRSEKETSHYLAKAINDKATKIEPGEITAIDMDMETLFEKNPDKKILYFLRDLAASFFNEGEMEFLLDGSVDFDAILGKMSIPVKEKIKTNIGNKSKK